MAEKPAFFGPAENAGMHERAAHYLRFFAFVAATLPPDYEAIICVNLDDVMFVHVDVPVFVFQKPWFRRSILLPDIDFLRHGFFEDAAWRDKTDYDDKAIRAVFAGATSGRGIREVDVHERGLPRLRAAEYFWGNADVDFRLPRIVQCNTPAAAAALAALPFCRIDELTMAQQYDFRFLLSMDGNGATCSRVALGLRSNGVLLKYASDHILYYFHGLQPWVHFIPIEDDADVGLVIGQERTAPGTYRDIAQAGAVFAARFLNRRAVTAYMRELLLLAPGCFENPVSQAAAAPMAAVPDDDAVGLMQLVVHVQDHGDLSPDEAGWAGVPGSGKWIEGFTLAMGAGIAGVQFVYQGMQASAVLTEDTPGGTYCGTHGQSLPLLGLCVRLEGSRRGEIDLCYEACFIDGSRAGPVSTGSVCRAVSGAPLEAIRLIARRR